MAASTTGSGSTTTTGSGGGVAVVIGGGGGGAITTGCSIITGSSVGGVQLSHDANTNTPKIALNNFNLIIKTPISPLFQTIGP